MELNQLQPTPNFSRGPSRFLRPSTSTLILDAIDRGIDSAPKIMVEAGVGSTRFYEILSSLIDQGEVEVRKEKRFPFATTYIRVHYNFFR